MNIFKSSKFYSIFPFPYPLTLHYLLLIFLYISNEA